MGGEGGEGKAFDNYDREMLKIKQPTNKQTSKQVACKAHTKQKASKQNA